MDTEFNWAPSTVTLVSDGFMTGWRGTLPKQWFYYNGYAGLQDIAMVISMGVVPLIGNSATVLWFSMPDLKKKEVVRQVHAVRQLIYDINPRSTVFFVTHVPLKSINMKVINYNKNLLFAIRKIKREKPDLDTRAIALHHWCIKKRKLWAMAADILPSEINKLLFLIVNEVMDMLGL